MSNCSLFPTIAFSPDCKLFVVDDSVNKVPSTNIGLIRNTGNAEDKKRINEDYESFNHNIDSFPAHQIDDKHFDLWNHESFYCQQDDTKFRLDFNQFRQGFIKDYTIDSFKCIFPYHH